MYQGSYLFLVLGSCLTMFACQKNQTESKAISEHQIMAYYVPSEDKKVTELPLDRLTHIIFSFTEVEDSKMIFKSKDLSTSLHDLVKESLHHPQLKVMIACGGWGGSGGFSDMANTESNRAIFIKSVIEFIKEYDLDGIDLDWEYPGLPGIGNTYRPEDKANFTVLVSELREALDTLKPDLLLTFAAAGWENYFDHIELAAIMRQVDYMNVMTYDLAGGTERTNHHTALYSATDSVYSSRSADRIIKFCLDKGVDPQQIVIGGAFYGRSWKGVSTDRNGLHQAYSGARSSHSYRALLEMMENDANYKGYWDNDAQAPFIYSAIDSTFITYDDPESLGAKSKYVKENNLGGIMFWQLSHDTENDDLVNAIYYELW